jgi:hypothetical protein
MHLLRHERRWIINLDDVEIKAGLDSDSETGKPRLFLA